MVNNRTCPFCGKKDTHYKGLGIFYCKKCKKEFSWFDEIRSFDGTSK
jgi:ribosomal protein L37AE/L43A